MSVDAEVVVIGAGAAGLLAAARAAERGRKVILLEKNREPGVKILMSGGTRCNLTHAVDRRGIIEAFGDQGRFLHSPLAALPPERLVELFETEGVPTKIEETGKVFPASDKARDVLQALMRRLRRSGAGLAAEEPVLQLAHRQSTFEIKTTRRTIQAGKVIVTTGGKSYPGCGTSGDGYDWMRELGHLIVPPVPALVPITIRADWAKSLRGITIPTAGVQIVGPPKDSRQPETSKRAVLAATTDAVLFAHFGLTGPAILDVSRAVARHSQPRSLQIVCDFLPDIRREALVDELRRLASQSGKKQMNVLLTEHLPRRLVDALLAQSGLDPSLRAANLSRQQRDEVVAVLKSTPFPVTGTVGFKKAEVTAGGVALAEVDSKTMQSKRLANLFLAGEILDLDGPIGGYNFQAAFSTGWLAGGSV